MPVGEVVTESIGSAGNELKREQDSGHSSVTTLPPSHIAQDGTFIHLPPPTDAERIRFFERSIARHGLLEDDLKTAQGGKRIADEETQKKDEKEAEKKSSDPKIHPLALASARLQTNGINELNRAINLHSLVATGDYFGLSNIVDPALELVTAATATAAGEKVAGESSAAGADARPATAAATGRKLDEEEERTRAQYILKRKRAQFEKAALTLKRHRARLNASVVAQAKPDQRLRELRPQWRLVAPEHGTRALPHAARPTEVVAADVDVYFRHGGSTLGRLASRVPRYATMELKDDYNVKKEVENFQKKFFPDEKNEIVTQKDTDAMDVDEKEDAIMSEKNKLKESDGKATGKTNSEPKSDCTKAEPFAIADPALGKIDADFDPNKVVMLTLQFDIEKPSSGFVQSACLEPMIASSSSKSSSNESKTSSKEDEQLLVALQHSLFCAKLFESVRRELAPDTEDVGQIRTSATTQSAVWLSGESEENFLPPPSLMMNNGGGNDRDKRACGLAPLCVVHVHEGDVKVLLDCEYSLRVRLVESYPKAGSNGRKVNDPKQDTEANNNKDSGSQNPAQLNNLCRALLLHAQETYHLHSVESEDKARKEKLEEEKKLEELRKKNPNIMSVPQVRKKDSFSSPRILQSCVSLGTKMLFERRIRVSLRRVNAWLRSSSGEELSIEWLPLSFFDLTAQFTISFKTWSIDVNIVCDELTVTCFTASGQYKKVKFHTERQFELYLKTALKRLI